jgi:uncharacterized lipoprotein YmbA
MTAPTFIRPLYSLRDQAGRAIVLLWAVLGCLGQPGLVGASEAEQAEKAALALAQPLEKDGFVFRAEAWVRELQPQMGKAIKVQLFKGNDYRFCIAVPPQSGVQITATVLDFDGKPGGKIRVVEGGWGVVLEYSPKKTGVYAVAIRQTEAGQTRSITCSMVTGYQ